MDFEKSMRYTNKRRTICEVVRECNDIMFSFNEEDDLPHELSEIHSRLKEIHTMAKKMTKKLYKYSKEWDKDFWEANPDYEEDLKRRMDE